MTHTGPKDSTGGPVVEWRSRAKVEKSHKEETQGVAKSISWTKKCENVSGNLHFLQQDCLLWFFGHWISLTLQLWKDRLIIFVNELCFSAFRGGPVRTTACDNGAPRIRDIERFSMLRRQVWFAYLHAPGPQVETWCVTVTHCNSFTQAGLTRNGILPHRHALHFGAWKLRNFDRELCHICFFLTCGLCVWDLIMTSIFNRFHAIVTNYNNNMGRNKWRWSLKTLHRSICNIGVHFSAYCLLTRCVFRWGSTSSRWGNVASSLRVPSCGLQWQRPREVEKNKT